MHGCIIWHCKPTAAKARFHWIFRVLLQQVPISTPKWLFSGKAPPCEPRPLCLICNSRWTPSREDHVTGSPLTPRAGRSGRSHTVTSRQGVEDMRYIDMVNLFFGHYRKEDRYATVYKTISYGSPNGGACVYR